MKVKVHVNTSICTSNFIEALLIIIEQKQSGEVRKGLWHLNE